MGRLCIINDFYRLTTIENLLAFGSTFTAEFFKKELNNLLPRTLQSLLFSKSELNVQNLRTANL